MKSALCMQASIIIMDAGDDEATAAATANKQSIKRENRKEIFSLI